MDEVARLSPKDRDDLFRAAAARKGLSEAIIEKDFWVCWVLKRLFELPDPPAGLIFKGGTSLSKVYGIIERFSEDVDLSFDRAGLGFGGANDPAAASSGKKQTAALEGLTEACQRAVHEVLSPRLRTAFEGKLGPSSDEAPWSIRPANDDPDAATLLFEYPRLAGMNNPIPYIAPVVRLEFGARSDHWPATEGSVTPYAAEALPELFREPSCAVNTLSAERTFWEKATLLHKWHHAPQEKPIPERQSRHYYDLYRLSQSRVCDAAFGQMGLLRTVAEHKRVFFKQAWARYDLAVPGTLKLLPPEERKRSIETDYRAMAAMFFGEVPTFEEMMAGIRALEARINAVAND